MPKTVLISCINSTTINDGGTEYAPLGNGILISLPTETDTQVTYRTALTITQLYVRVNTNGTSSASTANIRINAGNGNGSVSIGAGATGEFKDSSGSDSIAVADEANVSFVNGGGGDFTVSILSVVCQNAATTTFFCTCIVTSVNGNTQTFFRGLTGGNETSTEGDAQAEFTSAGTFQNLFINVITDSYTAGATTFTMRVNGVDGNVTISIPAGNTGFFEDTANSDTISEGDLVGIKIITASSSAAQTSRSISLQYSTTSAALLMQFANNNGSPGTTNAAQTEYWGMGSSTSGDSTEGPQRAECQLSLTLSNLNVNIPTNTTDGASTIALRVNGATSDLSISVNAATTGTFNDTDSVVVAETDEINYITVGGGSSGDIKLGAIVLLAEVPEDPPISGAALLNTNSKFWG